MNFTFWKKPLRLPGGNQGFMPLGDTAGSGKATPSGGGTVTTGVPAGGGTGNICHGSLGAVSVHVGSSVG